MDHIFPDEEEDLGFQQFIDDQFNKLVQNFSNFENTILPPSSINPTNVKDYTEPFSKNEKDTPQSTRHQFTMLLQDFDESENKMLPSCQFDSKNVQTFSDWKRIGEIQDSEIIIKERKERAREFVLGSRSNAIQNVNVTSFISGGGGGMEGGRVKGTVGSFTTFTNATTYPPGDGCSSSSGGGGGGGGAAGLFMNYKNVTTYAAGSRFCVGSSSGKNAWRHTGLNRTAKVSRRRKKRKYRGVYESEAEAACRMELQKIRNREAAVRAYERKQEYEVQLKAQIQNLRKENEFHKKLLKFLEGKPINLTQKQLKRTISCPT